MAPDCNNGLTALLVIGSILFGLAGNCIDTQQGCKLATDVLRR